MSAPNARNIDRRPIVRAQIAFAAIRGADAIRMTMSLIKTPSPIKNALWPLIAAYGGRAMDLA
jgi:hypothetical protein